MEKKNRNIIILLSCIAAVLAITIVAVAIISINSINVLNDSIDKSETERERLFKLTEEYEKRIKELSADIDDKVDQISDKNESIASLESTIASLNVELEQLITEGLIDDERAKKLTDRIAILNDELVKSKAELKELEFELDSWKSLLSVDIGAQAELVTELFELLATGAPNRVLEKDPDDKTSDEDTDTYEKYPVLSMYYMDLASGYTIGYNEDLVRYSASLIKLPYVYAVLREIDEYERQRFFFDDEGNALYDEQGNALYEGSHPNLDENGELIYPEGDEKYDLSTKWIYDEETMMVEGSGLIQTLEDGTELTYRDLIEYTILYSDNIAFAQICNIYGYTSFYNLIYRLSIDGTKQGFMMLSAEDCGKVLKEVYEFAENNEKYGKYLADLMSRSNYNIMIGGGVHDFIEISHKYGWDKDAYHDMAIVWDEKPYLLVIMTDLDDGRYEDIYFIHEVSALISKIHNGFYSYYDNLTVSPEAAPTAEQ